MDELEDLHTDQTNIYIYIFFFTTMETDGKGWYPI